MKTFAIIPSKIFTPVLDKLLADLQCSPVDGILLLDNGLPEYYIRNHMVCFGVDVTQINCRDMSIYQMWNEAWKMLKFQYPDEELNIAILNDDIEIHKETIPIMVQALRSQDDLAIVYPDHRTRVLLVCEPAIDYTDTTAGAGGMTGYCFMIKGELDIPYIDQNLKLYWGDDDLVKQVISRGYKIGRVNGLPILHAGSYTINRMDSGERNRLMEADRAYFNQKYGENRSPVG